MGTATGYSQRVPKARYTPDPATAARVQAVVEKYRRIQEMEAEYKRDLAEVAAEEGMTVAYLAEQLGVERKTVYRHLGRKMS